MKGVGAGDQLRADQGILTVKGFCIYLFQSVTAQIIVAISGGCSKMNVTDTGLLHGFQHLHLVIFRILVNRLKTFL